MISRSFLARSQERAYTSPIWYAPGTGRHARLAAAWTVVATGLAAAAAAQIPPPPDAQRALSDQYEGTSYSPYAGRELPGRQMPSRLLWGDTHLHTAMSMDAGAFGNRLGIEEAYRFARGEEVVSSTGMPVKLSRPPTSSSSPTIRTTWGCFPTSWPASPMSWPTRRARSGTSASRRARASRWPSS